MVKLALLGMVLLLAVGTANMATAQPEPYPGCPQGIAVPDPWNNPGLVGDCKALLEARDALAGTAKLNWSDRVPIGSWDGIELGGSPLRVTHLELWRYGLNGVIPPALGRLSELRVLNLNTNELTGDIPPELGMLHSLERMNISGNPLNGPIPPALGDLENIRTLVLQSDLTGPIPPELGNLTRLRHLALNVNQLTGAIPPELGDLSELEFLYLHNNQLTGPIPPELGQLSKLRVLDFQSNQLTGGIPQELSQLRSLEFLNLSSNELSGEIPAALGGLRFSVHVVLNNNGFTGCVPWKLISNLRINHPVRYNPRRTPKALGLPFCFAVEDDPMTVSSASLLTVPEGDTLAIDPADLLDNDIDKAGNGLTIVEVSDAVNGTASLDGARVAYTHDGSETTTGSFEYTASNGQDTDSATVRLEVTPVNDPPVGVADSATVDEGKVVSIGVAALLANDTDHEEDPLTITSVGNAVNGGVALVGEAASYRHDGSETTTGGFTYTVSDGDNSVAVRVSIAGWAGKRPDGCRRRHG